MKRVVLESPYAGDIEKNVTYARACVKDCLRRGESPVASHLLFTQPGILDDSKEKERVKRIDAGHIWIFVCDAMVVYEDLGISKGMEQGIALARMLGKPIEYRKIYG